MSNSQFTLMIALEHHDENRARLREKPGDRDRKPAHDLLSRLIAYRMYESLIAKTGWLRDKLLGTATRMVGPGMVAFVRVQRVSTATRRKFVSII